jgi:Holliday junction resolvasome RuvABC DNA-binding subunit
MAPAEYQLSENFALAAKLRQCAGLLAQQEADRFRVAAYRRAASVLEGLDRPVRQMFTARGRDGLMDLQGVGHVIAGAIAEMLTTGNWSRLSRLRGASEPEKLFRTIPGIGPKLARRVTEELHLETLEALEMAAHGARLAKVSGFGPRRCEMVRAALAERLGRPRPRHLSEPQQRPSVGLLLDIDREYRVKAKAGALPKIAPKRFNPLGEAWLSVLHTKRGDWDLTALYSNSRLAHELGRSRDWVIVYYESQAQPEGQCTIVTETRGPCLGLRVVRGRENEYLELWKREHIVPEAPPVRCSQHDRPGPDAAPRARSAPILLSG